MTDVIYDIRNEEIVWYDGKEYVMCSLCGNHFIRGWWKAHTIGCRVGLWY